MQSITRRKFIQNTGIIAGSAAFSGSVLDPVRAASVDAELAFKPAVELTRLLREKQLSSVELTQFFIDRIETFDDAINAVVVRDFDRALEAAKAADAALARGELSGPLHGLPMTIKESYDIAGLSTSWGVPAEVGNIAAEDAVVVSRFKNAGAHFMGKTNVPFMLNDLQTYNDIYGTTNNPWNLERTPGGSSGGTAAALAAGLTGLDCGSDIGGSIRNPAHCCGIYGHKPTLGIVPSRGQTPPGIPNTAQDPDLAVVGPLARSADDLALAMDIIAGPDILMASGWQLELPEPRMTSLAELRVALWPDDLVMPVATEIADRVAEIGEQLSQLGATVSDTARPEFSTRTSHETYRTILYAMVAGPDFNIDFQTWAALNDQRGVIRMAWQRFFQDWDILVCPIIPTEAFPHDHSDGATRTLMVDGKALPYFDQVFWAGLATLPYLPSTVFPTGLSRNGLPIGLQAIGAAFDDRTTIEFARLMSEVRGGFVAPPGYGV